MMKILLIGFANLKFMPYIKFYLDQIDMGRHETHVLYWNRDCSLEAYEQNVTYHEFAYPMHDDIAKIRKLDGFLKYRHFAIDLLEHNHFDFLVIMHSIPAVLLGNYVRSKFLKHFIFDYRDYTYEFIPCYKRVIHNVIYASYATFVSSDAFRSELPKVDHIFTSHNILLDSLNHRTDNECSEHHPIRIAFWGYIRHPLINEQIILKLANDPRFELHYYGREQEVAAKLKEITFTRNIHNVFFHGEYRSEDRYVFSKETDLIHNIYSNTESPPQKMAITNKYYDGLVFYIPQLCMKGSYMGMLVEQNEVGYVCDPWSDHFADNIFYYYMNIDRTKLRAKCNQALESVLTQYGTGKEVVCNAIERVNKGE